MNTVDGELSYKLDEEYCCRPLPQLFLALADIAEREHSGTVGGEHLSIADGELADNPLLEPVLGYFDTPVLEHSRVFLEHARSLVSVLLSMKFGQVIISAGHDSAGSCSL